jgi:hypothetical protein
LAKGLYLTQDGRVLVEYGKRRVPISSAQYRANGYCPTYDKLRIEAPAARAGYGARRVVGASAMGRPVPQKHPNADPADEQVSQ